MVQDQQIWQNRITLTEEHHLRNSDANFPFITTQSVLFKLTSKLVNFEKKNLFFYLLGFLTFKSKECSSDRFLEL